MCGKRSRGILLNTLNNINEQTTFLRGFSHLPHYMFQEFLLQKIFSCADMAAYLKWRFDHLSQFLYNGNSCQQGLHPQIQASLRTHNH